MSAHDHAASNEEPGFIDEDEDLFDFPRVELTLDGLRDAPKAKSAPQGDRLTSIAAPLPAARPASTPALSSVPGTAPAIVAPVEAPPLLADLATTEPALKPDTARVSRRFTLRAALIALFVLNSAGFWFLWRTHVSFGAGIDNLRTEIGDAAKRLERARREATERSSNAPPIIGGSIEPAPLDVLERSSLALAESEIRAGEYGTARRRLNRLLAQADRMNSSLRAEIEPRATFLVARSYQDEADARRRTQR